MVAGRRLVGLARAGAASQPGSDGGRTDEQEEIPPLDRHPDTLPRVWRASHPTCPRPSDDGRRAQSTGGASTAPPPAAPDKARRKVRIATMAAARAGRSVWAAEFGSGNAPEWHHRLLAWPVPRWHVHVVIAACQWNPLVLNSSRMLSRFHRPPLPRRAQDSEQVAVRRPVVII